MNKQESAPLSAVAIFVARQLQDTNLIIYMCIYIYIYIHVCIYISKRT